MHIEQLEHIEKTLSKKLSAHRYEHSRGVAYTAACMSMKFGCDMNQAFLAGILHDCAKFYSNEELLAHCEKFHLTISPTERSMPYLLHAKLGAYLALHKYNVQDQELCSAITWHTTGHSNMTLLEKILYVADYIEPNRDKAPNLAEIRKISFENLDEAVYLVARDTLQYLKQTGTPFDPASDETYQFYKKLCKQNRPEEPVQI